MTPASILFRPLLPALLTLPSLAQDASAPRATATAPDTVAIAKKVFPAIVSVRTFVRTEPQADAAAPTPDVKGQPAEATGWVVSASGERDYPGFRPFSSGSGFFIGDSGDVLTALQPLQAAGDKLADLVEIESMDGQRAIAEVVGIEPTLQLAVLRGAVFTSWEKPTFPGLAFGDSERLELGSWLCGAGDPLGPERFMATGLLVAKPSRDCYQELMSATYMQATMFVPDGAFGGPLVDANGDVVGILSRVEIEGVGIAASQGSAWALPSKILAGLYESIRTAGTTQSPFLGFSVMSRAELATKLGFQAFQKLPKPKHGIVLENVFDPSPAAAAELKPDDWLTHFDGVEIHAPVGFQKQLYLAGVGREVTLTFFRDGQTFTKQLTIVKRPDAAKPR